MNLEFLKNERKYWQEIRKLRNLKEVMVGFIDQQEITEEQQVLYMEGHNDYFHVCLCDDKFAGYVGVIDDDIRVAVSPSFQRKGIGKFLIKELIKNDKTAIAKIKIENKASIALFESCGFKKKYFILEQDGENNE